MISEQSLLEIIRDALELENREINVTTRLDDIEEYDSLGALSVFTAISQKTNEKSDDLDLTEASSVQELFDILKKAKLAS